MMQGMTCRIIIMHIEEDVTVDISVLLRNSAISFLHSHECHFSLVHSGINS